MSSAAISDLDHVHVIDHHPVIQHHLAKLRHKDTTPSEFRALIAKLASLLIYQASEDLEVTDVDIPTPLTNATCKHLAQRVGLVPILRAGLGMIDPVLNLIDNAEVWHLGFYRDEQTLEPVEYYQKLRPDDPTDVAYILDPMLATGGSAIAALNTLTDWGVPRIKVLAIISAPEGIRAIREAYPDVPVHVCVVDSHLNEHGFIVPGLGDAGDRTFNTIPSD